MKKNEKLHKPVHVFKYGGNAMVDEQLKTRVLEAICSIQNEDRHVVIVHGGGPFIKEALSKADIISEFIKGHRKTSVEAMETVEMALKGKVNGNLVSIINKLGRKAVGLSGKDGNMIVAKKRWHEEKVDGKLVRTDLGRVGEVSKVDTSLLYLLLNNGYIPVITCVADDADGHTHNINGDLFAGSVAGALKATSFTLLTDVDGIMKDIDNPDSLIREVRLADLKEMESKEIIKGGMLPKVEACKLAIEEGAKKARIINGTRPEQIELILSEREIGTTIS